MYKGTRNKLFALSWCAPIAPSSMLCSCRKRMQFERRQLQQQQQQQQTATTTTATTTTKNTTTTRLNVTSQTVADLRRKRAKFESPYLRRFSLRRRLIERKQFSDAYAQKWEQLLVQQRDTLNAAIDQVSQFRGQLLQEEQISQKMTRTRNSRYN